MSADSPRPNARDNLVFGDGDNTNNTYDTDEDDDISIIGDNVEEDAKPREVHATYRRPSIYFEIFKEIIETVLEHESHLLNEEEVACLARFSDMTYDAKYLLIRLSLRKADKWHRLNRLKYHRELKDDEAITRAIRELCRTPCEPDDAADVDVKVEVKEEESEVIDLTLDDDDDDDCAGPPESGPSSLGILATDAAVNDDLGYFCEDDESMTVRQLLEALTIEELKDIAKQMKIKTIGNRAGLISGLEVSAARQTTLRQYVVKKSSAKSSTHSKGANGLSKPSLKQSTLSLNPKGKRQIAINQAEVLRDMAMKRLGKCVRVNTAVSSLFQRLSLIYFRHTQYSPALITPALLARAKKRFYPTYNWKRTPDIWRSRQDLVDYMSALRLEARVDEIFEGINGPTRPRGRSTASKTPARVFRTPSTPASRVDTPTRAKTDDSCVDKENEPVVGGQEGADGGEGEESPRIAQARAVAELLDEVYPRWLGLQEAKDEYPDRPRGLQRFECGHVLTRVVCKGAFALGVLKDHEREITVLDALLAQTRWRRGRRGRWHERRALVLMTHLRKDAETQRLALERVTEALQDHDTHIIYRPKLERRLMTLEKRLKVPEEERHLSKDDVRKPEKVEIEGFRIWNSSRRNKSTSKSRSTSRPQTPDNRGGATLHSWVQTTPKAGDATTSANPGVPDPDRWKGKSVWRGNGSKEVTVETLALEYYERQGFRGFHCEGRIVGTLFGMLFWDILFAEIPGAFETPYQSAPLDITDDTFYHARQDMIEKRLSEIESGKARSIIECVDSTHREKRTWCVGVKWDLFERKDLLEIAEGLGGGALSAICRLLCEDYSGRGGGVPDLCIWNARLHKCMFVEVKGPGDSLQENQKVWIDVLLRAGVDVHICHVSEFGKSKQKKEKKRPAKKTPKSKEKVVDSDSEPEPVLESEDEDAPRAALPVADVAEQPRREKKRAAPDDADELPTFHGSSTPSRSSLPPVLNRAEVVILSPSKKRKV